MFANHSKRPGKFSRAILFIRLAGAAVPKPCLPTSMKSSVPQEKKVP